MATQAYAAELQATPQPPQPPQAAPPPPPAAPQPPQPPAAATPQPQYVTELQNPQPPAQPPGGQKQYLTDLPAGPTPSQPVSTPSLSPASQQFIVVTVSEGTMRASETVSEASPGATASQTGVPTQVVQQAQGTQQRLLVQTSVQAKPGHVSPLQLTSIPVPQQVLPAQRLVVQSTPPGSKAGPISLAVHSPPERSPVQANSNSSKTAGTPAGAVPPQQLQVHSVQQSVPVPPERSVVQATPQAPKASPVQGLAQVHVAPEVQQLQQVAGPHVYPSPVQYVEGGDASYATSAIRPSTYPYAETPLYTQTPGTGYYEAAGTAPQVSTPATSQAVASSGSVPMYVSGGQVVASATSSGAAASNNGGGGGSAGGGGGGGGGSGGASGGGASGSSAGGTYVIQGGYMLGSASQSYSHTTRASPATVQWLLDNYETAEGVSLPRSTLYCHYLLHCQDQKLEPVNAASFGKLIRSVFMGLRTRRLGTRGNSKYHYYGLRIKASSPLLRLLEDQQHMAMRGQPFAQKQRLKPIQKLEGMTNGVAVGPQQASGLSDISAQVQQYQQFLDASRSLPDFSELDLQGKALPEGVGPGDLKAFQVLYREHCEAIVDVMVNLQFTLVETLWKTFWRHHLNPPSEAPPLAVHDEAEKRLPKASLVLLAKFEPVLQWTKHCDNVLYQGLVDILIPDVLRPIPSALTQAIRNFAKSLESWLTHAMVNIPEEMLRVKVAAAGAFAQTLRRYTSLNHLAQAARAVLQNTAQINQMLSDLNRVDFANVQEQASWVCRCEDRVVQRLEQDFKVTLQQQNSLEQWAAWLDGVVSQVLKPYQGSAGFPKAAKLFLLKWSFYSSMVIRDLTLRSAASFGSFHLIRLLYDEYMYYLIEHRVAQAKGETPIAVMGEFANLATSLNPLDPDKDEEEEEEEESEDELPQDISLAAGGQSPALGPEALEPPAKLARTDARGLFVQALPSS
ncbi:MHC class II regulatory factor RFX1 isoform X1 [Sorex araneus]|uniref:MHC class II regulatory factor RFX1 isoform X1 n=1 Tax=Sorex araneus TaxID=42254 RepID=UPI002433DC12|nr:MHC class II regulatory factor RFX1 isoform X1 [Sorex araneus]XP_054982805.1 MHC class II regulatory factor RFX1 isoform X1 [Sorex araneus]